MPYDGEEQPRYEYKNSYDRFKKDKEIRLYKSDYIVIDKASGKPAIQLITFSYRFFSSVPLVHTSATRCDVQSRWPGRDFVAGIGRNLKN